MVKKLLEKKKKARAYKLENTLSPWRGGISADVV
jgi:hypothetical protein